MTTEQMITDLIYHVCLAFTVSSIVSYAAAKYWYGSAKNQSKSTLNKIEDSLHQDNAFQINFLMAAVNQRILKIENQIANLKSISA